VFRPRFKSADVSEENIGSIVGVKIYRWNFVDISEESTGSTFRVENKPGMKQ
jgi:hypothetical protein